MNDRSISLFDENLEPVPATTRAPAADLARLIAQTLPPADRSDTATPFAGEPSVDLIAMALGAEDDAMTLMRSLYASGDANRALEIGATVLDRSDADPYGGLILVLDENDLVLDEDDAPNGIACE